MIFSSLRNSSISVTFFSLCQCRRLFTGLAETKPECLDTDQEFKCDLLNFRTFWGGGANDQFGYRTLPLIILFCNQNSRPNNRFPLITFQITQIVRNHYSVQFLQVQATFLLVSLQPTTPWSMYLALLSQNAPENSIFRTPQIQLSSAARRTEPSLVHYGPFLPPHSSSLTSRLSWWKSLWDQLRLQTGPGKRRKPWVCKKGFTFCLSGCIAQAHKQLLWLLFRRGGQEKQTTLKLGWSCILVLF